MTNASDTTAASILTEAAKIVAGSRNTTNGHRERCFHDIANCWNAYLSARKDGGPITAVDAAGYAAIAGEIGVGEVKQCV